MFCRIHVITQAAKCRHLPSTKRACWTFNSAIRLLLGISGCTALDLLNSFSPLPNDVNVDDYGQSLFFIWRKIIVLLYGINIMARMYNRADIICASFGQDQYIFLGMLYLSRGCTDRNLHPPGLCGLLECYAYRQSIIWWPSTS